MKETDDYKKDVLIERSKGRMSSGCTYYVRPKEPCFNRSRPIVIYDSEDSIKRIRNMIVRWYWPMKYWKIDTIVIGANSESNAIREYWRVCDPSMKEKLIEPVEILNYKKED